MPNFKYVAKDDAGKTISGSFEAQDRAQAVDILRKRNLIIVSVSEALPRLRLSMASFGEKKVKSDELVVFSRQLATMVDAGIPLVGALDILGEQVGNKVFGSTILKIRNDIETGSSLSEALSKHKKIIFYAVRQYGQGGRVQRHA